MPADESITANPTKTILSTLAALIIPFVLILGITNLWFKNYYVPSESMVPALEVNDRVFGLSPLFWEPERGDIVVFHDSQNWLPEPDQNLVKRIIGLPGDTVSCCSPEGYVLINGQPYPESYIVGENETFEPQVVPPGHYFVLGDNRERSADSRYHIETGTQFVPEEDFVAKVWAIWSPSWRTL